MEQDIKNSSRNYSNLWHIMLAASFTMFIASIAVKYLVSRPQDMHTILFLGNSMINRLFRVISLIFLLSVLALYFYIENLYKSFACEKDVLRIRRSLTIYQRMLFGIMVISTVQIIISIVDIANAQYISIAYILHSKILGYFGYLFFSIWFIAITYKHIKTIRNIPPSVLISAKGKKDECG